MGKNCICLTDVRALPEEDLLPLAETLPPERREKVLRRKGAERRRAVGAGLLLRCVLADFSLPEDSASADERGRPLIPGHPELSLSLSHSGDLALCLLSETPAAVDVQVGGRIPEAVVRRCFGPGARALFYAAGTPGEREAAFLRLWCRLEARVKLRQDWSFRCWDLLAPEPGFRYWKLQLDGYGCAVYGAETLVPAPVRVLRYSTGVLEQTGELSLLPD